MSRAILKFFYFFCETYKKAPLIKFISFFKKKQINFITKSSNFLKYFMSTKRQNPGSELRSYLQECGGRKILSPKAIFGKAKNAEF